MATHDETLATFEGADLDELKSRVREIFDVQDRKYGFPPKKYKKCFVGNEAVAALVEHEIASDIEDAVHIGNMLLQANVFHHVHDEHAFKNEYLFYRFISDEERGEVQRKPDGSAVSWADFLQPFSRDSDEEGLQPSVPDRDPDLGDFAQDDLDTIGVAPLDDHNVTLLDHVHPKEWVDPTPEPKYNLVVIGAGAGGLVSSAGAAGLGAKVALIESHLLGGDCLNVGCVPSKALIRCARAAAAARRAGAFGVHTGEVRVDFAAVMERMRGLRAQISHHDSAERFTKELGVDVYIGKGTFTGKNTVEVNGKTLTFAKAVVATGATAAVPPIPGLADAPYLTNATIFNLTELPQRLGVIGAGPIGLELAQSFQRFGSDVTVFSRGETILPKEDPEAAQVVVDSMRRDGVTFTRNTKYVRVESDGGKPPIRLVIETPEKGEHTLELDGLLVATGRKPNITGLGLENAGIEYDRRLGVQVNERLQTTNPAVFAVGDVCTRYQFTHMADFMARMVIRNALFFGRDKVSSLLIPWATYTEPEVAHVGLYERDLEERGIEYQTFTRYLKEVDRAILEGETEGFVKVHVKKGSDEILGATIVGPHAGDMISELSVAMAGEIGLGTLANVIHPYPTTAEAIRQCGDLYNRTRLTPTVKKIFNRVMSLQRR